MFLYVYLQIHALSAVSKGIGSLGTPMVQPGLGPYVFQNDPDNLAPFSFSQVSGIGVPVGCAEQYGRLPGFAKYCWW